MRSSMSFTRPPRRKAASSTKPATTCAASSAPTPRPARPPGPRFRKHSPVNACAPPLLVRGGVLVGLRAASALRPQSGMVSCRPLGDAVGAERAKRGMSMYLLSNFMGARGGAGGNRRERPAGVFLHERRRQSRVQPFEGPAVTEQLLCENLSQ